jgi:hypothetical protein
MWARLISLSGGVSALLALGGIVIAIVKWVGQSGDQIPPIPFSGALLAGAALGAS